MMEEKNNLNINNIIPIGFVEFLPNAHKMNIPHDEKNVLKKSAQISEEVVKKAQESQKRWHENLKRIRKREKKLKKVKNYIRADKTLVDKKIKEKDLQKLKEKISYAQSMLREHEEKQTAKRKEILHKADKNAEERHAYIVMKNKEYEKRLMEKHEEEIPPEELRKNRNAVKKALREKAIAKYKEETKESVEHTKEKWKIRRKELKEQEKILKEHTENIDIIEKKALKRAKAKDSLLKSAAEYRLTRRKYYQALKAASTKKMRERIALAFEHFKMMRDRMKDFVNDSGLNHEKVSSTIKEIVERGKQNREETLFLAGSPIGLINVLGATEFFKLKRKRIEKIISTAEETRMEYIKAKEILAKVTRKKHANAMFASGNPKELFKRLKHFEFFLLRKEREIYKIIRKALKRLEEKDGILVPPDRKRGLLYKKICKITGFLWNPRIVTEHDKSYFILNSSRKNIHLITKRLIQNIEEILDNVLISYLMFSIAHEEIGNDKSLSFRDIILKENTRSLISSLTPVKYDEATYIMSLEAKENGYESEHFEKIYSLIKESKSAVKQNNNLKDIITTPPPQLKNADKETVFNNELFDALVKEIREAIMETPNYEKISEIEEIIRKEEETKEKEGTKTARIIERKRIKKEYNRKLYYKKLIEEANLTAHEKVNNERFLIDLFF